MTPCGAASVFSAYMSFHYCVGSWMLPGTSSLGVSKRGTFDRGDFQDVFFQFHQSTAVSGAGSRHGRSVGTPNSVVIIEVITVERSGLN